MQSKISCFNTTILKKNLTRFWPFAVLYGLYLIIAHPMVLYLELTNNLMGYSDTRAWEIVGDHFMGMTEPISVLLAAIVIAIAVFSYLYQSRSANMMHAFPVTRTELFVTNYLSGLILMVIPQILAALASNLVILGKANSMIWSVWAWFGITVGETIFFYSFACFIVMFTGQLLTAGLFYMIWNFLYVASISLINVVGDLMIYGLSGQLISMIRHPLFPVAYLLGKVGFYVDGSTRIYYVQGISSLLIYAGAGLIFAVLAWYIYQKRRIECAGDFLSMRWTAPVFRWGMALVGGVACALFMTYLTGEYTTRNHMAAKFVVFLVIFGAVLFFVAQMFVEKSFRVFKKRIAVECVSCVAVLLVGVAMLQFDIFGIESYVPGTEEISMVSLWGNGSVSFEDTADVDKVRALHELILDHSGEQKAQSQMIGALETTEDGVVEPLCQYIDFTYTLKNGKSVSRAYSIVTYDTAFAEELTSLGDELFHDPEAMKRAYFGMNYKELNWQVAGATLEYPEETTEGDYVYNSYTIYGSKEEMQKFFEAVLADFDAGAFAEDVSREEPSIAANLILELATDRGQDEIRLAGSNHLSYFDNDSIASGTRVSSYLYLNEMCTHTIDALIEMGEIDSMDDLRVQY